MMRIVTPNGEPGSYKNQTRKELKGIESTRRKEFVAFAHLSYPVLYLT